MWSERQAVEIFHLLFLRAFGARVDKTLFALKGGCNLRFFFKSIRYSEDIDLDLHTMSLHTLQNNVESVFQGQAFTRALQAQQIALTKYSSPKQTETTQRWKFSLRVGDATHTIPSKLEFSRRALDSKAVLESVDSEIIRQYQLHSILVQHYPREIAFQQKISALALRSETQARDIFDLLLLLNAGAGIVPLPTAVVTQVGRAIENAMTVGYDAFAGQVLAFLDPDYQEDYRARKTWEDLQAKVVDALENLQA